MKKKIIWEYFISPFLSNLEEIDPTFEINNYLPDEISEMGRPTTILNTPMGFIPLTEHNDPTKVFNFWTAHTNFKITEETKNIVDNVPGVETFDILTPYRFRIACAKAFNSAEIKSQITATLCKTEKTTSKIDSLAKIPAESKNKIKILKNTLLKQHNNFVIYLLPNGEIDYKVAETQKDLLEHIKYYLELKNGVGGYIIVNRTK